MYQQYIAGINKQVEHNIRKADAIVYLEINAILNEMDHKHEPL